MIDKIKLSGLDDYGIHRFYHKAMSTVFDIFIYHDSYSYAFQAASEAFIQLDLIEQDLSRFLENSDIDLLCTLVLDDFLDKKDQVSILIDTTSLSINAIPKIEFV